MRTFRTVLEQKIWERRQTIEEFAEYAEIFAREHREPGSIGVRHLQRLIAGCGSKGRPLGPLRPATARLLESIFGISVDELLAPPTQLACAVDGVADRRSRASAPTWPRSNTSMPGHRLRNGIESEGETPIGALGQPSHRFG